MPPGLWRPLGSHGPRRPAPAVPISIQQSPGPTAPGFVLFKASSASDEFSKPESSALGQGHQATWLWTPTPSRSLAFCIGGLFGSGERLTANPRHLPFQQSRTNTQSSADAVYMQGRCSGDVDRLEPASIGGRLRRSGLGSTRQLPPARECQLGIFAAPLAVLALTQWGAPVSTSFLVLSAFVPKNTTRTCCSIHWPATHGFCHGPGGLWSSDVAAGADRFEQSAAEPQPLAGPAMDLHRLAVEPMAGARHGQHLCLPARELNLSSMVAATLMLCVGLCVLVAIGGGPIQEVVRNKINTGDLRSATVIDFLFGCVLFWKASISTFPLSTTWVFLGLLAGREIAIRWRLHLIDRQPLNAVLGRDVFKAGIGIVVSLAVAFAIQPLKAMG